jgi:hypothetical protein
MSWAIDLEALEQAIISGSDFYRDGRKTELNLGGFVASEVAQ